MSVLRKQILFDYDLFDGSTSIELKKYHKFKFLSFKCTWNGLTFDEGGSYNGVIQFTQNNNVDDTTYDEIPQLKVNLDSASGSDTIELNVFAGMNVKLTIDVGVLTGGLLGIDLVAKK
jgi:hypothetical protein